MSSSAARVPEPVLVVRPDDAPLGRCVMCRQPFKDGQQVETWTHKDGNPGDRRHYLGLCPPVEEDDVDEAQAEHDAALLFATQAWSFLLVLLCLLVVAGGIPLCILLWKAAL